MFWNSSRFIFSPSNPIGKTGILIKTKTNLCCVFWNYQIHNSFQYFKAIYSQANINLLPEVVQVHIHSCLWYLRILMHHNNTSLSCHIISAHVDCRPRTNSSYFCISQARARLSSLNCAYTYRSIYFELLLESRLFDLYLVYYMENIVETSAYIRACLNVDYFNIVFKIGIRIWKISEMRAAENMTEF